MARISFLFVISCLYARAQTLVCSGCHLKESAAQPGTRMGRALMVPGKNSILNEHRKLSFQQGKYSYVVETRDDGKSTYTVSDGDGAISLPLEWGFGAGAQTFVLIKDGAFYESRVSFYPKTQSLYITMGDEHLNPQTLEEAIGRHLEMTEVNACFGCHSLNSEKNHRLNLEGLTPGVGCERCHTGAGAHAASLLQSKRPDKLGALSSESMATYCGQCHRSWETVVRMNVRGESNVRFQPYRMAMSKCFDGKDPRISCVACHNPHEEVVRTSAGYDKNCVACHSHQQKVCKVAKSDCVSCHMPKSKQAADHIAFTDHMIRIVRPGEGYPN